MNRQQLGVQARIAQHDSALQQAFNDAEADIHAEWAACWTQRGRERCHHDLKALKRLRAKLVTTATNAPRD